MKTISFCFILGILSANSCLAGSNWQPDSLTLVYADKAEGFYPSQLDSSLHYATLVLERVRMQEIPSYLEEEMLTLLGRIHNQKGELAQAESFYNQSIAISNRKENRGALANNYYRLGQLSRKKNILEEALDYYQSSLKISEELNDIDNQARLYNSMGLLYKQWGKPGLSSEYYALSIEKSKEAGNQNALANAYLNLGNLKAQNAEYSEARDYYDQFQRIQEKRKDTLALVMSITNLGNLYMAEGRYDQALAKYLESVRLLEDNGIENTSLGNVYNNIGTVYRKQENLTKALNYYQNSFTIYKNIGDVTDKADVLKNIGTVYNQLGETDSALTYFDLALTEYGDINQAKKAATYFQTGEVHYSNGEYRKALNYYEKAAHIFETFNDDRNLALTYNGIGVCHFFLENYDTAFDYYQRAYEKSVASNYLQVKKNALFNIYEIYEMRGQYEKALETYLLYAGKKDSLINEQKNRDILELSTKYETEKKDTEISLLQAEQERNEALIEKRTAERRSLFIGVIGLIALIIAIAWWFIYKIRKEKIIAGQKEHIYRQEIDSLMEKQQLESVQAMLEGQDKERKRLAAELHDRLGSLLSLVKMYFSSMDNSIKESKPELYKSFQDGKEILDDTFREVREIIKEMNDGKVSGKGLGEDIRKLLNKIDKFGITIESEVKLERDYPDSVELNLYRIIQEALSNALKYSRADSIKLSLRETGQYLELAVQDNGSGFDPAKITNPGEHYGLENMENRAKMLGGSFNLQTGKGRGVRIEIKIPLEQSESKILITEDVHD